MKTLLITSLLALPSTLFAGQATITGVGRVPVAPDYVQLAIDVNAECYKTPSEATQAADAIASQIATFLEAKIDRTKGDDVIANGGYTQPFSRYVSGPNGESKKACAGTFQKRSSITLKKTDVATFPALFDEIQNLVYGQFKPGDISDESASAVATIGTPTTQLFHATQARWERVSQGEAVQNAIAKFESMFFADCEISGYSIVEYSEPNRYAREQPYERVQEAFSAGAPSSAPLSFDSHWVNTAINVKFEFHGGQCHKKSTKQEL